MVSLEDRGHNYETSGVNGVPNGLHMASLCEKEENRSNGAYKWVGTTVWGVIVTVHYWVGEVVPEFILLISPISTGGFEIRDLQVRALAKSIFFNGLHFGFSHLGVFCELVRASMFQVAPFLGKGVTGSLILPKQVRLGRSCLAERSDLRSLLWGWKVWLGRFCEDILSDLVTLLG